MTPATGLDVLMAYLLDRVLGDPPRPTHPVVLMGKGITLGERLVRRMARSPLGLRVGGVLLASVVVASVYGLARLGVAVAREVDPRLGTALSVWLVATAVAGRELGRSAMAVRDALAAGDLELARRRLSMIVGRDTEELSAEEVARGAVETVAENLVDAVVAPLAYAFLGGAPLVLAYRAVNTMDSMLGYRDPRYVHIGWFPARLDDFANYLPARLAGVLLVVSAALLGMDWRGAARVIARDARRHPSPNAGIPEAGVAGALRVRLGGLNTYGGRPAPRAFMGEPLRPLDHRRIVEAVRLVTAASHGAALLGLAIWLAAA